MNSQPTVPIDERPLPEGFIRDPKAARERNPEAYDEAIAWGWEVLLCKVCGMAVLPMPEDNVFWWHAAGKCKEQP